MPAKRWSATWRKMTLGALFLIPSALSHAAELTVLPASLGFPPGTAATSTQSIFIRAVRPGSIKIDSVGIEYVSGPDDTRLGIDAAKVVDFAAGKTGTTIPVKIELAQAAFMRPGSYKIAIRIKGQRSPEAAPPPAAAQPPTAVDDLIELSLTRAPAQIAINLANNSRVDITRGYSGSKGDLRVPFSVSQDSGPAIEALKLTASAVVKSSDNKLAPGKIALNPAEVRIANGAAAAALVFSDFERIGDFQTNLTFTAPGLAKSVIVPLTVRVTDGWCLPFIMILAGVGAGALVHFLVRLWRPRQLSSYRLLQLRTRLEAMAPAVGRAATRHRYDRLLARLQSLADAIDVDATTDQAIQQLETDVTTLQTELATADATAGDNLKQQQAVLEKAKRDLRPYGGAAAAELASLETELDAVARDYNAGSTEEALDRISALAERLARTRIELAQAVLGAMRAEIRNVPEEDVRTQLSTQAQQAAVSLNQPNPDIGQILGELHQAIAEALGITRDEGAAAPPPAPLAVVAGTPPDLIRVGNRVQFRIEPAPAKQVRLIRWTIDGGHLSSGTAIAVTRTYPVSGRYTVGAEIEYQDATSDMAASLRVTVLPSETAKLLERIRAGIQYADLALLLAAVVLAAVTGMLDRYVDKPFGTVADYCWAFLWGFGIDNVVRGFTATFTKLGTK